MANFLVCSVPDCDKPVHAGGCCGSHYWRLRKHGDPLAGRTPEGEPLRFINEVSLTHLGDECLLWPFSKRGGYGKLKIDGKNVFAHRYICTLVHGSPPSPKHDAAHSCGNGHLGCITKGHLSWKTHAENIQDKLIHDTHSRGERHVLSKLTEEQVRQIIALKGTRTKSDLAAEFGVSRTTIYRIQTGRSWSWLEQAAQ